MPERRPALLARVVGMLGPGVARVLAPQTGWPGLVEVAVAGGPAPHRVALHVGKVIRTHRGRDAVERRIENPGQGHPVAAPPGHLPAIVGLWEETWEEAERPVLVAFDAELRMARGTRQSMFVPLALLHEAAERGWAEHRSTSGELLVALHPVLLPVLLEARAGRVPLDAAAVAEVIASTGLAGPTPDVPGERARRATSQLVRRAMFSKRVREAYGDACAMCGLGAGLVAGAHIYPASAPGSPDVTTNGIALCHNHHAAFDAHRVHVDPATLAIRLHDDLLAAARAGGAAAAFVATTRPALHQPRVHRDRPDLEMLRRRYAHFAPLYDWAQRPDAPERAP